jgi:hypothetical protein
VASSPPLSFGSLTPWNSGRFRVPIALWRRPAHPLRQRTNMRAMVKTTYQATQSISECVDSVLMITNVESLIEQAKRGDRIAAKQILGMASAYLRTEMFGPLPPELGRYLAAALARASLGEPADIALNLKKQRGGRPRQEHRTKLQIGHLIYKAMKDGNTLEAASYELGERIQAGIEVNGNFFGYTKGPDSKTLEGIFNEVRSEIECAYNKVRSEIESPLKT